MKKLVLVFLAAAFSSPAFAQTPAQHEVNVSVGHYKYVEPSDHSISISGAKIGGGYTGTFILSKQQHWFGKADAHGVFGDTSYDGWCRPYLITPDKTSPNGYFLDLGEESACTESGERDWYVEGRGLVGKDFVGQHWTWSPEVGVGVRHLSNGLEGLSGFRTDNYLYVPIGITARSKAPRLLSVNIEYDQLLRGWQTTRDSALGGGLIPATPTAPAFTIEGFTDISFEQHGGWAFRASAKYQLTQRVSLEPAFIHWRVNDSPVEIETVAFTVNNTTAHEQFGAYEPLNTTNEFVLKVGFRLGR